MDEDLAVFVVELPDLLAAGCEVFKRFAMHTHGAVRWRQNVHGDVRRERYWDLQRVDSLPLVAGKDGQIRPANGVGREAAIDPAQCDSAWIQFDLK